MGIWVGRYAMVAGEVREHGPWLVERLRLRDEESVRLLVLTEPVDERSAEFCHEVADAVVELFSRESYSLTGGLLRALRQAHANLAEWNRRSLREHRVAVGVTCVAIRDGEATVAQVGPGVVYVAGPDGLERRSTDGAPAAVPVGGVDPVEPAFFAVPLADHQLLLLTGDVERTVPPAAIAGLLAAGPERALAELFVRTREVRDMTAALVADVDAVDAPAELPPELAAEIAPPPEPAAVTTVDSGGEPEAERRAARSLAALGRARVAGREAGAPRPWLPWPLLVAMALAAAAVVAAVLFALPPLLAGDREARLEEALAAAGLELEDAALAAGAGDRRERLDAALSEIERAAALAPDDPRVAALEARAGAALASLDAVIEVSALRTVLRFEGTLTAPFTPAVLAFGGGALWLVDGERGRVFAVDPAGGVAPAEVYRRGVRYGGVVAADPLALAWEARSGRLLLLDAARALFAIAPGGEPQPLPLRGVAGLRSVSAIATYDGNLYLLDPDAGEVWRYLAAGDGYDSERDPRLGGAPIDGASALVVDREIFVLLADGVLHFRAAREPASLLRGVDAAPQSPAGMVEDVERGRFYVADRGGRRIVVSGRGGEFIEQYRHPAFFDLRGLALAGGGEELYVLTGDGVYAFDPLR